MILFLLRKHVAFLGRSVLHINLSLVGRGPGEVHISRSRGRTPSWKWRTKSKPRLVAQAQLKRPEVRANPSPSHRVSALSRGRYMQGWKATGAL